MGSSKSTKENQGGTQLIIIIILSISCIALIIALAVVVSKASADTTNSKGDENNSANGFCSESTKLPEPEIPKSKGVFDDLSEQEIYAVKTYMLNQKN